MGRRGELLTVILLTYNHEKTLARAFDSILEQKTEFDFNIFVLEDCSTDGTQRVCRDYKDKYPDRIELFLNEKNLGVAENFKQGLLKVKTKYYAFLEGDDYWCNENKLQRQVNALEQNADCFMCGHNTLCKDLVNNEEWLLIKSSEFEIKARYSVKDRFSVHPSSRVYRNAIDLTHLPANMVFDTHIYLVYMSRGDLFYIDEVMSVFNKTGVGFWSGKSPMQKKIVALDLRYKANHYFDFAYEHKYYPRSKTLTILKGLFGVKAGWFLFYHLERERLRLKSILTGERPGR
jgi:glycosyltransferase involved in cell wall biosynthesis